MSEEAPNPFALTVPLLIFVLQEAVKVIDAAEHVAAYIYVIAERERRKQTKRLSPEAGVEAVKVIARALTDAIMATERA